MRLLLFLPLHQCLLNLTGQSDDILDLSRGKAMDYRAKVGWKGGTGEETEWSQAMQLYVYCEEYQLATNMYDKLVTTELGIMRSFPTSQTRYFFYALIAMHNFKATGKRKYRCAAQSHITVIQGWVVNQHAINLAHKLQILEAQRLATLKRRSTCIAADDDRLRVAFQKAIVSSTKAGFLQDAALAAHLASQAISDGDHAQYFFEQAKRLYLRWGARGVVEHLKKKKMYSHEAFHSNRSMDDASTFRPGIRCREQFDKSLAASHRCIPDAASSQSE
jgi:hypothetical protein